MYERTLYAGWGDMDANAHMRNTAFLDKAADTRIAFFSQRGFSPTEFARQRFGPAIMRDEIEYKREINLLQEIRVNFAMLGLSEDGSRFAMQNDILQLDGSLCGRVTSHGGWIDLDRRRLTAPPPALLQALRSLDRAKEFTVLPSSLRG